MAQIESSESILLPDEPIRFTPREMDRMLLHCTKLNASDITIQTESRILTEIHGRLYPVTSRKMSSTEVQDMLNAIYGPNGTTQVSSGTDVDTHYEIRPDRQSRFRFRVNGTGCQVEGHEGIQITCRTIPSEPPSLSTMKLDQNIIANMAPPQGTIIVTGATGSGKSTLLAAMIKEIIAGQEANRKVLTYEAPIEFVYDGCLKPSSIVSQSEIPRHLPSFAAGIRNALRRKPGLILVGEARDAETIAAAIDAALTGHPVYTTLHSNGVADCVRRMISTFPADERHGRALDILETLRMVIWQKLVPTVDKKRVALREYLIFDDEVRDILVTTEVELIAAKTRELLKQRGQPMIVDATKKFEAGIIDERTYNLLRVGSQSADQDALMAAKLKGAENA
ncbi:MAG TPA: Dot/Icm type IV secretion system ATPase DotB [Gammaproteobacteria bacterium]|nr:Dot/Icm type IV secretion system ATPase DotB [Gammaproteobacteria bacterium]